MHYLYSIVLWHCQYATVLLDKSKPLLIIVSQQYYIFGKSIPAALTITPLLMVDLQRRSKKMEIDEFEFKIW